MGQGGTHDWEAPSGSMQLGGTTRGAEGLKGDSGDGAEELDAFAEDKVEGSWAEPSSTKVT